MGLCAVPRFVRPIQYAWEYRQAACKLVVLMSCLCISVLLLLACTANENMYCSHACMYCLC